jgi:hypothetical protein
MEHLGDEVNRPNRLTHPVELVSSERGSLHCLQASFMMAAQSILGRVLSWEEADQLTGYVEGRDTWPYALFLSAAEMGMSIHSIELFDPQAMAKDPSEEVRRIFGPGEIAESVIGGMDLAYESELAARCLNNPRISFEVRVPNTADIESAISTDRLALVSLDYGLLHSTGEYEGHLVLVSGIDDVQAEIFDPGPPGDAALHLSREALEAAMHSPTEDSGAVIFVGKAGR